MRSFAFHSPTVGPECTFSLVGSSRGPGNRGPDSMDRAEGNRRRERMSDYTPSCNTLIGRRLLVPRGSNPQGLAAAVRQVSNGRQEVGNRNSRQRTRMSQLSGPKRQQGAETFAFQETFNVVGVQDLIHQNLPDQFRGGGTGCEISAISRWQFFDFARAEN
jgi:hypothetical protein